MYLFVVAFVTTFCHPMLCFSRVHMDSVRHHFVNDHRVNRPASSSDNCLFCLPERNIVPRLQAFAFSLSAMLRLVIEKQQSRPFRTRVLDSFAAPVVSQRDRIEGGRTAHDIK
ncbi:hypothetical protein LZ30DRAFT_291736 [Colletotrichum cereale]|nr:hypothetical protein LZ30DRAFT_291736 [Colletotrichum cereale]